MPDYGPDQELPGVVDTTNGKVLGSVSTVFLPEYEWIDHPDHYNDNPSGVECIEIVRHCNFNVGTVIKHLWRAGLKPGQDTLRDLKKAQWYLEDEIARVEAESD